MGQRAAPQPSLTLTTFQDSIIRQRTCLECSFLGTLPSKREGLGAVVQTSLQPLLLHNQV